MPRSKSSKPSKSTPKAYPVLETRQIELASFGRFLRSAITRRDAAAIQAARPKIRRVRGDATGLVFKLAYDAKPSRQDVAVGLALHELAMAAKDPHAAAFSNALYYLHLINKKAKHFDAELIRKWLARVVPMGPGYAPVFANAALLYVALGELDAATRMVAGALLYRDDDAAKLETDPDLEALHGHKRFKQLFAKSASNETYRTVFDCGGKPVVGKRDEGLEAAILADPTAVEPYLIYGDWLQEQGDPRGELIAIQHAIAKSPRSKVHRAREAAFLKEHAAQLRGVVSNTAASDGDDSMTLEWHLGFVRKARFKYVAYQVEDSHVPALEDVVREFFRSASARFLQELVIGVHEPGESHDEVVDALVKTGPHPALRSLMIAERTHEESELSWVELGKLGKLWKTFPKLERLTIEAGQFDLGQIETSSLRELEIRTTGMSMANLERIFTAKWPQLEKLRLWFGSAEYGSKAKVADLQPMLDGVGLPNLTYLGLQNAEFTNELAAALPSAKILRRLKTLDLSMGTLTDTGLATLLANAKAFSHLDVLDLSSNHLVGRRDPKVKSLAKRVMLEDQRELYDFLEESGGRYVALGE